jgi:putative PIN family toxin of toxin-antitoxin system
LGTPDEVSPRIVFDTSVVISALLFRRGQLAWLRTHWRDGACKPLIARDTAAELTRVLHYGKFHLSFELFQETLAGYLPYCEIVEVTRKCSVQCRDKKDQPFLDLAHSGKADALVTGDRDLLVLAGQTKFLIESPEEYRHRAGWN